jgi:hypothetical protein
MGAGAGGGAGAPRTPLPPSPTPSLSGASFAGPALGSLLEGLKGGLGKGPAPRVSNAFRRKVRSPAGPAESRTCCSLLALFNELLWGFCYVFAGADRRYCMFASMRARAAFKALQTLRGRASALFHLSLIAARCAQSLTSFSGMVSRESATVGPPRSSEEAGGRLRPAVGRQSASEAVSLQVRFAAAPAAACKRS